MYDLLQCMPTVPGAIGAFRRAALREVGGVSDDTLAEDTDLTMALIRAGWRVVYEERARAWTEAPGHAAPAVAAALPLVLRHDAGDVEAPPRGGRARPVGPVRAARAAAISRCSRSSLPLLAPLVDIFAVYGLFFLDPLETAVGLAGASSASSWSRASYAFRLDRETRAAAVGRCRCSSSSTGS